VVLFLVGCSHEPVVVDPPADAFVGELCSSEPGTANVTAQVVGPTRVYDHAFGGGILNGASGSPITLKLVLANQSPVSPGCASPGENCGSDVLVAKIDVLASGSELGGHDANVFDVLGFSAPGTLTITAWSNPFDASPGHIAGSLSASTEAIAIQGTFDTVFCVEMLGVPL